MDLFQLKEDALDRLPSVVRIELMRLSRKSYEWSPRRHLKRWTERARKGWSVEDTFDFDGYMAKVIAGGVQEIRNSLHGCPPQLAPDDDSDVEKGTEAWGVILDEIVEGFELYWREGGYQLETDDTAKEINEKIEHSRDLFRAWMPHLWD